MKVSLNYGNLEACNQTHGDGNTKNINKLNVYFQFWIGIYSPKYSLVISIIYEVQ